MSKTDQDTDDAAVRIARTTMTGDLRDCLLDFMKHDKEILPWNMLSEEKQREKIEKVTNAVSMAVEKAVKLIAADARSVIEGKLEKVTVKDGIKAEVSLSKHSEFRHSLMDSQGDIVLMVVANTAAYEGERKAARPEPNQRPLLDDDQDEAA